MPRATSAMATAMGNGPTYEVRVDGPPSGQLIAALGVSAVEEPAQTLLRTPPFDQGSLLGLIDRVCAFGLELVEIRRISAMDRPRGDPGHSPAERNRAAGRYCYELTIRGLLGPAVLAALAGPYGASARRSNSWTFRCPAPRGPTALMESLAAHDAAVVSLYRIGGACRASGGHSPTVVP